MRRAQLIGIVVADTEAHARAAARQVRVEYQDMPALLSAMEVADAPKELAKEFTVRAAARSHWQDSRTHPAFSPCTGGECLRW